MTSNMFGGMLNITLLNFNSFYMSLLGVIGDPVYLWSCDVHCGAFLAMLSSFCLCLWPRPFSV